MQVARLAQSGHYLTLKEAQVVQVHPSSSLTGRPEWIIFDEFLTTTKNFIRTCTPVLPQWLIRAGSRYYDLELFPEGDAKDEISEVMASMRL